MKYFIAALCLVILLIGGFYALNAYIYSEKQGDAPQSEAPTGGTTLTGDEGGPRYMDIETYVRTNISALSPVKEQLGGTFYVTALEVHDGTGIVSYEDGHNAYTADFTYTTKEDGRTVITSFLVRP